MADRITEWGDRAVLIACALTTLAWALGWLQ